jgi:hypothetical protein
MHWQDLGADWPKGSAIDRAVFTILVLVATLATLLMAGFATGL